MKTFFQTIVSNLKEAIFAPKDYFERTKRRATIMLLLPLIFIVGGESILIGLISAISSVEYRTPEMFFKLVGSSSSSFLTLSIVVLLSFGSLLGANLYYARHIRKSEKELEELSKKASREEAYTLLKNEFNNLIDTGKSEDAFLFAKWLLHRYPEEADQDAELIRKLINKHDGTRLTQLKALMIEEPQK